MVISAPVFQGRNPRPAGAGREPAVSGTVSRRAPACVVGGPATVRSVGASR